MRKILCPTDGSDHSGPAIILAAELADAFKASLTICAVNVLMGPARGPDYRIWTDEEVQKLLDDAVVLAGKSGQTKPERVLLMGREAAAAIVHHADVEGFDCIVLGTGDRRGLSRLMVGSVAADVAHRAPCTVVIAR